MKNSKGKTIRAKSKRELIELFIKVRVDDDDIINSNKKGCYIKGSYLITEGLKKAKIYSWNKKIVLIGKNFFGYQERINNWHLEKKYSHKGWTVVSVDNIKFSDINSPLVDKYKTFTSIIKHYVREIGECIIFVDFIINGNKRYGQYDYIKIIKLQKEFEKIRKALRIPQKLIDEKVNMTVCRNIYKGWSIKTTKYKHLNNKGSFYLQTSIFTPEELHILARKNWIWKNFTERGFHGYSKEFKEETYDNEKLRQEWLDKIVEQNRNLLSISFNNHRRTIYEWRENVRYIDATLKELNYYSLCTNKNKNLRLITFQSTKYVQVESGYLLPLENSKLLCKRFKRECEIYNNRNSNSYFEPIPLGMVEVFFPSTGLSMQAYSAYIEPNESYNMLQLCIGCNKFLESTILEFINYYNLDLNYEKQKS